MSDNDFIRRRDAVLAVTAADKECLGANGAREFIRALPSAPTFTAADLERAWQPIETAPKDGTRVLIHSPETHTYTAIMAVFDLIEARWIEWDSWHPCEPTHWMPLPPPPADLAQRVKEDRT